jgi:hypothetical protein
VIAALIEPQNLWSLLGVCERVYFVCVCMMLFYLFATDKHL